MTRNLSMAKASRQDLARQEFAIKNYHRALKQYCAVEKCQALSTVAQKNHIMFFPRTLCRLKVVRLQIGAS